MAYVDEEFYNKYSGKITDNIIHKLERASDQIDSMTFNRIVGAGFSNLTDFQQEKIKKAVCLHVDFIEEYSEYFNSPLSGFSAGSISVTFNNNAIKTIGGITTSNEVYSLLQQTGLTCLRL